MDRNRKQNLSHRRVLGYQFLKLGPTTRQKNGPKITFTIITIAFVITHLLIGLNRKTVVNIYIFRLFSTKRFPQCKQAFFLSLLHHLLTSSVFDQMIICDFESGDF